MTSLARFLSDERGGAVVEFALISIVIALFIIVALLTVDLAGKP